MTAIPPAYDTTWRNDVQAASDAAKVLRIPSTGPESERLAVCASAAGEMICQYLDRSEPIPGVEVATPPPPLRFAHSAVTVELYRRKDAPFGVLDAWSPDTSTVRIGSDPLAGVRTMITPYRARWGLA